MAKSADHRLDATLDQIVDTAWSTTLFSGFRASAVRAVIIDDLNRHWTSGAQTESGDLMSLGGPRVIKRAAETADRHLKRLALLFHRVPGYHTNDETLSVRRVILKRARAEVLPRVTHAVRRALRFMQDEEPWENEISQRNAGATRCISRVTRCISRVTRCISRVTR